jgi:sugar O-acyltransferase (sialic acid O-acetyltransferase NeuD family)
MKKYLRKKQNGRLPKVVLVSGGGHCRSLIDVIEAEGRLQTAGIVDLPEHQNERVLGYAHIGTDDDLPALARKFDYFLIGAGQIGLPDLRERLSRLVAKAGGKVPTVCSPFARVSPHAKIGDGTVIFHQAVVNAAASVGANVIVNTCALIEHDAQVGAFCHISTGARVNGGCYVGVRCFVGSGAILRENIRLAEGTVVGCGSVVLEDTEPFGVYVGAPARRIRDGVEKKFKARVTSLI